MNFQSTYQKKEFMCEMSTQAKRKKDKLLKEFAEEQGVDADNVMISLSDIYKRKRGVEHG